MKQTIFRTVKFGFLGIILSMFLSSCGYNTMVTKEEAVAGQWAQVENQYQRRADLIGNLVETVKGETEFEKSTLEAVIQARASATQMKLDPNQLTDENIAKYEKYQNSLGGALGRLLSVAESYPTLQANQAFRELRNSLEGTENRIARERQKFNEVTQDYNTTIRKFPNNLMAGLFGFSKKGYFAAQPGSEIAPKIDFGTKK
jgi:LemA protein